MLTFKHRLRDKHAVELNRQARAVNCVWNYCNETSKKAWRDHHKWLSGFDLGRLTSGSSKELNLHAHTIQKVCQRFAIARDEAKRSGIRWRGKNSLGWVPFNTGHVAYDCGVFKFRKVSYIPMHTRRQLTSGSSLRAGAFNQDSRGRWYINVCVDVEPAIVAPVTYVGIDLGLKTLATLSNGVKFEAPRFYRESEASLATAQRRGKSKRVTAIHAKIANRRKDFLHKASNQIAKEFGCIIIGDVSPKTIARSTMAKSSLDAGWADFKCMLSYKSIRNGGSTFEVPERFTTQTCSMCGCLPASRPKGITGLSKRSWACDDCGAVHDRDINAATNILRSGLATFSGGTHHV